MSLTLHTAAQGHAPSFRAGFLAFLAATSLAGVARGQSIEVVPPASGAAPAVLVLSGASGPGSYREFADRVARSGYAAVLVDGNDVAILGGASAENLTRVLAKVRSDPRVVPGKVAVVGFSMGGGGALAHAVHRPDTVAAVAAFYPAVSRLPNISEAASKVAVPTLVFAGEQDRMGNCCLVESAREFDRVARAKGQTFQLVEYPNANHAFNLKGPAYRHDDAEDAWAKLVAFLSLHLPK